MPKLDIRMMREEDLPEVLKIEQNAFSTPLSGNDFLNELCHKCAFTKVGVHDQKIVGHICARYVDHEAYILTLAVHPDFRRQGAARLLMNDIMNELRQKGCVFLYLKVRISNNVARKFYELFDFRVVGMRKNYYEKPVEDALQMMGRL